MFAILSINITNMNKLNILVIGGSGYIGSVLVEKLLNKQYNITVVDNLYFNQSSLFHLCHYKNFKFILGDIRDKTLIKSEVNKNDVIIPLAALVGAPACAKDPALANEVNYESIRYINSIKSDAQLIIMPVTIVVMVQMIITFIMTKIHLLSLYQNTCFKNASRRSYPFKR